MLQNTENNCLKDYSFLKTIRCSVCRMTTHDGVRYLRRSPCHGDVGMVIRMGETDASGLGRREGDTGTQGLLVGCDLSVNTKQSL